MPVRAFLDSDGFTFRVTSQVIQRFQCPSGHFLIQTKSTASEALPRYRRVSMPVRAFLDSDSSYVPLARCPWCGFQCPSGHFLIQTSNCLSRCTRTCPYRFQCPSGHFLIQTLSPFRHAFTCRIEVSMPVRAFLDSDENEEKSSIR